MSDSTLKQQIIERIDNLDEDSQRRVLQYVQILESPKGIPGWYALQIAREIAFDPKD